MSWICGDMRTELVQRPLEDEWIIRCECGAEILLIPDVKEMERAINKHARFHAKNEKNSEKAIAVFEQTQDYLVQQVLITAGEKKRNDLGKETRMRSTSH